MSAPSDVDRPLLLVRHGRTASNASGLLLGRGDPPLDDRGLAEAAALGRALEAGRFGEIAAVVSSPLLRTRQTAEALGCPVEIDERLIELDYGEFEGVPLSSIDAATWQRWRTDLQFAPPGGESLASLGVRVRDACTDWSAPSLPEGTIVLVSHVSPIKAAVAWALGVSDEVAWRTHLDTASVSRIIHRRTGPVLSLFNDTAHLSQL